MDGTFAGDGPGPRCMIPHVKNVILASADQVAIDADGGEADGSSIPMSIKLHQDSLMTWASVAASPREIEIVGDDVDAGERELAFRRARSSEMTFASRMQHKIYWGPLRKPLEWSLKTVLAPWAYLASILYHDTFWYSVIAKRKMEEVLGSAWGRLFSNWEQLEPDESGYPSVGDAPAEYQRAGLSSFTRSLRLLGMAVREAPEFQARKRLAARR